MNIQAINLKSAKRRRQTVSRSGLTGKVYIVAAFLLVFGGLALCLNYRTWLNENIARIDKEAAQCRRKIHELDREIANLRITRESLSSWPHISGRIAKLELKLRLPQPSQVQNFVVNYEDSVPDGMKSMDKRVAMASQNK